MVIASGQEVQYRQLIIKLVIIVSEYEVETAVISIVSRIAISCALRTLLSFRGGGTTMANAVTNVTAAVAEIA